MDEEDELVSGTPPPSDDEEQDEEYEDDAAEQEDAAEEEEGEEEEVLKPKQVEKDVEAWYKYNKNYYPLPWSDGSTVGRIRDHNVAIYVDSAEQLGQMATSAKAWPSAKDIDPLAIVVTKCLFEKEQQLLGTTNKEGPYWWGARVGLKGHEGGDDTMHITHIPKPKANELVTHFAKNPSMARSALVTTFQPYLENAKPINIVACNIKADKTCNLKSLAVNPPRKKKDESATEMDEESSLKRKAEDGEEEPLPKKKAPSSEKKKSTQTTLMSSSKPKEPSADPKRSSLFPPKSNSQDSEKSTRDEAGCSTDNKKPKEPKEPKPKDKVTNDSEEVSSPAPASSSETSSVPVTKKAGVAMCVPTYHFTIKKGETSATFSFDLAHPATEDIVFTAIPQ